MNVGVKKVEQLVVPRGVQMEAHKADWRAGTKVAWMVELLGESLAAL